MFLPNAMRNILEYYYGFTQKKYEINEIFENIDSSKELNAFKRFINRESHSEVEIDDWQYFDAEKWIDYFKEVFKSTKDEGHYELMLEGKTSTKS